MSPDARGNRSQHEVTEMLQGQLVGDPHREICDVQVVELAPARISSRMSVTAAICPDSANPRRKS